MSGGVDSSTAAAILKNEGHEVIGVGLRLPECGTRDQRTRSCCGIAGMDDARRVARKIGIPFYVLNYEKIFERSVIDYFCKAYISGKTPNPCVQCNRVVKFGHLLKVAEGLGADYIATGHYARIRRDRRTGRHVLEKGVDHDKDQSYFLYALSQNQLARALFPLGEMTKQETRRLAGSFGLDVSKKPASQDICFLGDGGYRAFLAKRYPEAFRPGPIMSRDGRLLGHHRGIAYYTVGQRRGAGVASGTPLYVLSLDAATNTVILGKREEMRKHRISVSRTNWISCTNPAGPLNLSVKIRYRQMEIPATVVSGDNGHSEVIFSDPQIIAAAPGQSAVFYDRDMVVGGGIIQIFPRERCEDTTSIMDV